MTPRPVTLPHDAPISKALGVMRSQRFHEIPVLRNSRLIGMVTIESIARRGRWSPATKVEHLLVLPPLILPTTPFPEVAEQLLATGLRGAPVVGRRGELLGIISRTDLVRAMPNLAVFRSAEGPSVEEIARYAGEVVREDDQCRNLITQLRLLEDHPLPVVDRKGRVVGAVGVADLGEVLWRPVVGGKRDARANRSALEVKVGSIMHSPAITISIGASAIEAARVMSREKVSSVFVVENGRPTRVVGQSDLLSLAISRARPGAAREGVENVYVEITGLRGSADPGLLSEIDGGVAKGLRRIARYVRPTLLTLHFAPQGTHRTNDLTVEARLFTEQGRIFYASHTGWNLMAGVAGLLDELTAQTRRASETPRGKGRRRGLPPEADAATFEDPDLEAKIRAASGDDES
ncbi:MAG: CBS domain-containing protein [Candidatus Lutacidiplasmatales archaeon]|nr:CBS domain-containing protein [Thermoplasmata archaeon]